MTAVARVLVFFLFAATVHAGESWEAFFDPFLGDLKNELAEARAAGKRGVAIMYHFEECPYCRRMKQEVLWRPEVQKAYRADFTVIAVDTRGAQAITGIDGRVLPENVFAKSMGVRATPTFDFYAPDGTRLYRHVGGIFDPAEFVLLERFVASGAYRSQSFAQFKQQEKAKRS
ncbi:MAG TPA: thioredoxin fold domain-containing protein [Burkholderiales bacterium]|nr:thioredoxin fold domain-containing protein [Burkholderiales bacterium]